MKAMIVVLSPKESCDLLNGDLSVLPRKRFPKDYVGWVYIYCTNDRNKTLSYQAIPHNNKSSKGYNSFNDKDFDFQFMTLTKIDINNGWGWFARNNNLNGKVVARFWCDKVGKITSYPYGYEMYLSGSILTRDIQVMKENEICEKACLTKQELRKYIPCDKERTGYAINITKLEIFDEPKEIGDFYKVGYYKAAEEVYRDNLDDGYDKNRAWAKAERSVHNDFTLTCAPRSGWRYIDV